MGDHRGSITAEREIIVNQFALPCSGQFSAFDVREKTVLTQLIRVIVTAGEQYYVTLTCNWGSRMFHTHVGEQLIKVFGEAGRENLIIELIYSSTVGAEDHHITRINEQIS